MVVRTRWQGAAGRARKQRSEFGNVVRLEGIEPPALRSGGIGSGVATAIRLFVAVRVGPPRTAGW
jgi:hypothetical protein